MYVDGTKCIYLSSKARVGRQALAIRGCGAAYFVSKEVHVPRLGVRRADVDNASVDDGRNVDHLRYLSQRLQTKTTAAVQQHLTGVSRIVQASISPASPPGMSLLCTHHLLSADDLGVWQ